MESLKGRQNRVHHLVRFPGDHLFDSHAVNGWRFDEILELIEVRTLVFGLMQGLEALLEGLQVFLLDIRQVKMSRGERDDLLHHVSVPVGVALTSDSPQTAGGDGTDENKTFSEMLKNHSGFLSASHRRPAGESSCFTSATECNEVCRGFFESLQSGAENINFSSHFTRT